MTLPVVCPPTLSTAQKSYFHFGSPISTTDFLVSWNQRNPGEELPILPGPGTELEDVKQVPLEVLYAIRDATYRAVTEGIAYIKTYRAADPDRFLTRFGTPSTEETDPDEVDEVAREQPERAKVSVDKDIPVGERVRTQACIYSAL